MSRATAPLAIALTMSLASASFAAAPVAAPKREGIVKSLAVGFKAAREHRAAQGPGAIKRAFIATKTAVRDARLDAKQNLRQLGSKIDMKAHEAKVAIKDSAVARMTVSTLDVGRAVGRTLVVRPLKFLLRAMTWPVRKAWGVFRTELASVKATRAAKVASRRETALVEQIQKSALTKEEIKSLGQGRGVREQQIVDRALSAREASEAAAEEGKTVRTAEQRLDKHEQKIAMRLAKDPKVGLGDLQAMSEKGEISTSVMQKTVDIRVANPASRASLKSE